MESKRSSWWGRVVGERSRTRGSRKPSLRLVLAWALVCLAALAWAPSAAADEPGAGLVIVFGPDDVHEACIAFSETTISGVSLLSRAGLGAVTVNEPDGGVSVCRIAEVGCDFPQEACDCQCGDPCLGWHYWAWDGAAWQPWEGSPADRSVGSGDVDAWVWGSADDRPPALLDDGPCGPTLEQPVQISSDDAYPEPPAQPVTMSPTGRRAEPTRRPKHSLTPRQLPPPPATAPGTPGAPTEPAATATSTEPPRRPLPPPR